MTTQIETVPSPSCPSTAATPASPSSATLRITSCNDTSAVRYWAWVSPRAPAAPRNRCATAAGTRRSMMSSNSRPPALSASAAKNTTFFPGWNAGPGGNVAWNVPGSPSPAVSPSGISFLTLTHLAILIAYAINAVNTKHSEATAHWLEEGRDAVSGDLGGGGSPWPVVTGAAGEPRQPADCGAARVMPQEGRCWRGRRGGGRVRSALFWGGPPRRRGKGM